MKKIKGSIILILKGFLMGICDIAPGISGGTIAFITGIYERLMNGIKGYPSALFELLKSIIKRNGKFKENFRKLDLLFFIPLGLGIITAFGLGANIIKFMLEKHFAYTMSFFIGLILASSAVIYKEIKHHNLKNIMFGFIGLILGMSLSIAIPIKMNHSMPIIFLSGFLAIIAMLLPGIAGDFVLFILGQYEFMLNVFLNLRDNLKTFSVFLMGGILGALISAKVISYLLKKYHAKTLYVLLGLVIGSLNIPIRRIYSSDFSLNLPNLTTMLFLLLLGITAVYIINKIAERYYHKDFIVIDEKQH